MQNAKIIRELSSPDKEEAIAFVEAEMWARFAAADMTRGNLNIKTSADLADKMLDEWRKRFIDQG